MLPIRAGDVGSAAPARNISAMDATGPDDEGWIASSNGPDAVPGGVHDTGPDTGPAGRPSTRPQRRPPVSQRRYLVRRLGALGIVALVLIGAIKLVDALFGSDGDTEAAPVASDVVAETTAPVVTEASESTTPILAQPPPTPDNPARLLILGDSDAGTFGPYLETLMSETGIVTTQLDYKVSSGLSRPDFFDWPTHMAEVLPAADPDIVVVTFGGNDAQAITDASGAVLEGVPTGEAGGDVEWRAEYGARVGAAMDLLAAEGRTLVWVGIPNAQDPDFTARLRVQDEVVRAEAAERPGVRFVDTWQRFAGNEGGYAEYRIDPRDGQGKDVRADDGFHLNTNGAEILALDIAEVVRAVLRERGAAL
jgi:hypothetical protein